MEKSSNRFILREFLDTDYEEYASWWTKEGEAPPDIPSLPKFGIVSGDMKAVGFLANTDCDFGIITWWYCNPANEGKESYMSLKRTIMGLCQTASLLGKKKVFVYTGNNGMIKLLESLNFINHDGHLVAEVR